MRRLTEGLARVFLILFYELFVNISGSKIKKCLGGSTR